MEDYIFILIAILLSVFGAINRKKKQGQLPVEDKDATTEHRPSVFEQLFEDPLFREEKPQVKPPEMKTTLPLTTDRPFRKQSASGPVPSARVRKPQTAADIPDHPLKRQIHPLMKDFSLKKAVVYSEILQRKY
jgi:hypothetical protein